MTPDAEAESLAAALSYLDDMPMLLESSALLLDAGGWLGGKLPPVPSNSSDSLEYDPSELLETLSTSSLLDISLAEAAGIAPPSPVRLSPRLQLQIERQPAGEAPQQRQSLAMSAPSRLVQLRQQTAADQAKATHNRMVVPAAPASRALAKKPAGKKPLNYNPNRARDERRQELIYLRQKVKEMEEQLQLVHSNQAPGGNPAAIPMRLGQKRSLAAAAEPSYDRSSIVRSACTGNIKAQKTQHSMASAGSAQFVVPKVWQDMCARQLEQRIKAERENIRLKLILEGQIKIAKSMEKLLKKRETLRAMETCGSKRTKRVHLPPTNAQADTSIYDVLLAGVETSYKEVDAVFEANGLDHMETSHRDAQVRDGVNGMYLEVFANKVLPFDMRTTGEAVWQHFKGTEHNATRLARSYYSKTSEDFATTQDTMVERFGLEMHANNSRADFHVKQILRRYVEKDRVVIVWRSRIEPLEFSNKPLSGINFTEKGYVVVKPPSTMSQDFTLLQTCYIITPDLSDKSLNEDEQAGALTEFVLSSTAANITASHEMIENVLLDQALKKNSHV